MENKNRISAYDFIKLAFVLVLVAFVVVIVQPAEHPAPVAETNLPEFPPANFEWEYDPATHELMNPQGIQLYRLGSDGTFWQPVIPASVSLQLPGGYRRRQNSQGGWQIFDNSGAIIASWDTVEFRWVMGLIRTATPTATPEATATLEPSATPTPRPTLTPKPTFTRTATATATQSCNTPVETRLTAGQPARVVINLNLHTTPEMADNIFDANPALAIVDVLQGPLCVPYQESAYWWWEIRNDRGVTGWAVEAKLNGAEYFLAPLE